MVFLTIQDFITNLYKYTFLSVVPNFTYVFIFLASSTMVTGFLCRGVALTHPPSSRAQITERVVLCLYFPPGFHGLF